MNRTEIVSALKALFDEINRASTGDPKLRSALRDLASAAGHIDGNASKELRAKIGVSSPKKKTFGTTPPSNATEDKVFADPFPQHWHGNRGKGARRVERILSGKPVPPAEPASKEEEVAAPDNAQVLEDLTFQELKDLAATHGITLPGRLSRERLLTALKDQVIRE